MTWTHEDSSKLYVSHKWRMFRKEYIAKHKPTECLRCGTPISGSGITLDHIVPLTKDGGVHAYEEDNIQALCVRCNSSKNNRLSMRVNYFNSKVVEY